MTASTPDQGWVTYHLNLAVRNTSDDPVLLTTTSGDTTSGDTSRTTPSSARTVSLRTSDAAVSTDQNHPYPADFSHDDLRSLDFLVIPPGLAVTTPRAGMMIGSNRWSFHSFSATFKVPELLHPTQLSINPGIVYNGIATPVALDLTGVPQERAGFVNPKLDKAPQASFDSSSLSVSTAPVPGYIWTYDEDGGFTGLVDVTIKNTDITGDQPVNLTFAVLDGYGIIYRAIDYDPPSGCSSLPKSIGPGQTFTGSLCFSMPARNAYGAIPLGMLVTTPEDVKLYAFNADPENLTNCSSQDLSTTVRVAGVDRTVAHEQALAVPGTTDGSVSTDSSSEQVIDRINIQTPGDQNVSIRVTPNTPDGTSSSSWHLMLQDPSGTTVLAVVNGDPNTALVVRNVYLFCRGTYSFYIRPDIYPSDIKDFRYQVTVESGSVPAATPEPSPEVR